MTFNIQGLNSHIQELLKKLDGVEVTERFSSEDINVKVPEDLVDEFVELAEDLNIETEML